MKYLPMKSAEFEEMIRIVDFTFIMGKEIEKEKKSKEKMIIKFLQRYVHNKLKSYN